MSTLLLPFAAIWHEKAAALHPVATAGALFFAITGIFLVWLTCSWPTPRPAKFERADHFRPDHLPKKKIDTIVIGSGISGGWAAKEFTERGFKTLVLERGRDVKHIKDYPTANKFPYELEHLGEMTLENKKIIPVAAGCKSK